MSFSICRITDVDFLISSSLPLGLQSVMTAIPLLFSFPYKEEKSGGLRKVVKILEGLLRAGYWENLPSPCEAGDNQKEAETGTL